MISARPARPECCSRRSATVPATRSSISPLISGARASTWTDPASRPDNVVASCSTIASVITGAAGSTRTWSFSDAADHVGHRFQHLDRKSPARAARRECCLSSDRRPRRQSAPASAPVISGAAGSTRMLSLRLPATRAAIVVTISPVISGAAGSMRTLSRRRLATVTAICSSIASVIGGATGSTRMVPVRRSATVRRDLLRASQR